MTKLSENTLFKSITVAFLILIMHVLLIGGVGILMLLVSGIINHTAWFLAGIILLAAGAFLLYKRIKAEGKELKKAVGDLQGKDIEIRLLGGVASMKISSSVPGASQIESEHTKLLPSPSANNIDRLSRLSRLYEKQLITRDEYEKAKKEIFGEEDI